MAESYLATEASPGRDWNAAGASRRAHPRSHRFASILAGVLSLRSARGPFDIVGDVHGCLDELLQLLTALGYRVESRADDFVVAPPQGRTLAFVGDLVDRGPSTPAVLRLVMAMMRARQAFSVCGNRDVELVHALKGRAVRLTRGMTHTLEQLAVEPDGFRAKALHFLDSLPSHCILDEGRLVVAHAGLKETLQGRTSPEARAFALRGQLTGKLDAFGLPIRANWAAAYRGSALVVHGHTPVAEPLWINNTVNIDTGCVYGGHLTAFRYPERETVSVRARAIYHRSRSPFPLNPDLAPPSQ